MSKVTRAFIESVLTESTRLHEDPTQEDLTMKLIRAYKRPKWKPRKAGYVLGFHRTPGQNLESIKREGLLQSKAKGNQYNEPNRIWAYTDEDTVRGNRLPYVVFQVPEADIFRVNNVSFVVEFKSIPPKDILGIVRSYRLFSGGDETTGFTTAESPCYIEFLQQMNPRLLKEMFGLK